MRAFAVVGVPSAVIAFTAVPDAVVEAESIPVTTSTPVAPEDVSATIEYDVGIVTSCIDSLCAIGAPVPDADALPVATVFAVPRVTLLADNAAPSVGAVLLPPEIINVSASVPVPIANDQVEAVPAEVTLGIDTFVFPVTLGTVVVSSLLEQVNPILDSTFNFNFVVVGVTVVLNVAFEGRALPVVCVSNPVITAAVPSAPTATPEAVAFILVVVGVTVVVNVASLPSTLSVAPPEKDTADEEFVNVVASPRTLSPVPLLRVTLSLYARAPRLAKLS